MYGNFLFISLVYFTLLHRWRRWGGSERVDSSRYNNKESNNTWMNVNLISGPIRNEWARQTVGAEFVFSQNHFNSLWTPFDCNASSYNNNCDWTEAL